MTIFKHEGKKHKVVMSEASLVTHTLHSPVQKLGGTGIL